MARDDLLLAVGDLHAHLPRAAEITARARRAGCRRVLQLGDLEWSSRRPALARFASALDELACDSGVLWCFLGGNHDDWVELAELSERARRDDDGLVVLGRSLRYIPRPHRWVWAGVSFAALGGAWSFERRDPVAAVDPNTAGQPGPADLEALRAAGSVDVLCTHDAPGAVDMSEAAWDGSDLEGDLSTRRLLDRAVAALRPQLLLHGHWHFRHTTPLPAGTLVEGLSFQHARPEAHSALLDLSQGPLQLDSPGDPLPVRAPLGTD